ncbi:MAG: ATP-dependent helicase RecG [Chthoniobacter sp.]|jgi:ATP-dependent DNA helicase RecG|nr:ATP-dependent helicase RecG [Chthoniobacter sp.]
METTELIEAIGRGEDSANQFKEDFTNDLGVAAEMVAFSNSGGGRLYIGVSDDGRVTGLSASDVTRLNGLISNAASEGMKPPINPRTENVNHPDGLVMVVTISPGITKPYMDKNGVIWVKSGADKRRATSREEIQRMFQESGLVHGDEIPATGLGIGDLDMDYFRAFFDREYDEPLEKQDLPLAVLMENMNLADKHGTLNVAGALIFANRPQFRLPVFMVKAVCYPGTEIADHGYLDSQDIVGKLADVFQKTVAFILGNLRYPQGNGNINSEGEPEIARIAIEEIIANALIHRDYFIPAPVRVFVFANRVEIVSPGHLPNNLTVENIKNGNSNIRNPILASFAAKLLPYRGLGNGVRRVLKLHPHVDFLDNHAGNDFKVVLWRAGG